MNIVRTGLSLWLTLGLCANIKKAGQDHLETFLVTTRTSWVGRVATAIKLVGWSWSVRLNEGEWGEENVPRILNPTNPPCFRNNISSVRAPLDHWDVWLNKTKCCRCRHTVAPFIMRWANRLRRNSVCGSTLSGLPPGNARWALTRPAHSVCNWLRWAVTFWPKVNFTLT